MNKSLYFLNPGCDN